MVFKGVFIRRNHSLSDKFTILINGMKAGVAKALLKGAKWSTAQDSDSCPVEVRGFKSHPPHHLLVVDLMNC